MQNDLNYHDPEWDDNEIMPVGYQCLGCAQAFDMPGNCPICGNPLEPYG